MKSTRYYCSDVSFSPDGWKSVYIHIVEETTVDYVKTRAVERIVSLPFTTTRRERKDGVMVTKEVHAVRGGHFTEPFKNRAGFHAVAEVFGLENEKTIHEIDRASHAVGGALAKIRNCVGSVPAILNNLREQLNAAPLPIPDEALPAWSLYQSFKDVLHSFGRAEGDLEDEAEPVEPEPENEED